MGEEKRWEKHYSNIINDPYCAFETTSKVYSNNPDDINEDLSCSGNSKLTVDERIDLLEKAEEFRVKLLPSSIVNSTKIQFDENKFALLFPLGTPTINTQITHIVKHDH
ncbi:hypothetical protein DAETH_11780 [Deinococcus aetherius]|uniref:Uncharacterized protein n=1 Tax=Deinococcus aetherius TaxID=200252 RepID=A0ABN6REB4_9DEIO|nr:hypothetical protein DAETH_11780 [Deinococcus aetherius]